MPSAHATYEDETIKVEFSAWLERDNDLWEVTDIGIDGMEILGHKVDVSGFSKPLRNALCGLADGLEFE